MANTLPTTIEYFDNLLGEQLTEAGGGGGFTMANVKTVLNSQVSFSLFLPVLNQGMLGVVPVDTSAIYDNIPLYNGSVVIFPELRSEGSISVSGNAVRDESAGFITITGDCTITIS